VNIELFIFDLDGTLIDSKLDLAHAVNATRAHMGMGPLDIEQVSTYVGNGAPVLIRRALGPDAADDAIQAGLDYFLQYYREHKLDHTVLYPGVRDSLERLREARMHLAILTNKPVGVSRGIVEGLGLGAHFFQVYGGNSFDFKKPHPIGVEKLMDEANTGRDATMMIGDSSVDVHTARNAGVRSCGVRYGFAPETLGDPAPDMLIDRFEELADWALKERTGPVRS